MSYFASGTNCKPKLVHRLDIETSGVLVLAKTGKTATILTNYFKEGKAKVLFGLVAGKASEEKGTVEFPFNKNKNKFGSRSFERIKCITKSDGKLIKNAKHALLEYYLIESLAKAA